ncbi:MAG: hypothetical protein AAFU85_02075 [Planctomycetota bacterium]
MTDPQATTESAQEPSDTSLIDTLTYGITLPERTARSASAVVGGLVNETAGWLIPAAFRSSKTYSAFVQQALDMMVHDVGGVENENATDDAEESDLARKTVGGLLDLAGAATLHLSPMTVLAVFSDVAYGSSHYLEKLAGELQREGIIDDASTIHSVTDLLEQLEKVGSKCAETANAPPLSVDGMKETITGLVSEIKQADPTSLIPKREVERIWDDMEDVASSANVGLWQVSTTMTMFAIDKLSLTTRGALSSVRVAGSLLDEHLFSHYTDGLKSISETGLYETLSASSKPYLEAAWHNFDGSRETWTEELITGRMPRRWWETVTNWFRKKEPAKADG